MTVPVPPSTNALYANVPGRGRVKTRVYRRWIDAASWEAKVQLMEQRGHVPPLAAKVELKVWLPPGLDIDNIKAIGDLLQRLGVVANDRDIDHLDVWRCAERELRLEVRALEAGDGKQHAA